MASGAGMKILTIQEAKVVILRHCSDMTRPEDVVFTDVEQDLCQAQAALTCRELEAEYKEVVEAARLAGYLSGQNKAREETLKEVHLLNQSMVMGIEEFADYSTEGMKEFRKTVLAAFRPTWQEKIKEWTGHMQKETK